LKVLLQTPAAVIHRLENMKFLPIIVGVIAAVLLLNGSLGAIF
jgi:hypothetical protein